jgi:hypothetical protein
MMNHTAIEEAAISIYENITDTWVLTGGKLPPGWRPARRYTTAEVTVLADCSARRVPYTEEDIRDAAGLVDYELSPTEGEMAAIMAKFREMVASIDD